MSNNDDCRYNLSPLLASRSAWHHHEQKDPRGRAACVRAREFIDLHRQSGEHESERRCSCSIGGEDWRGVHTLLHG